jgi:hypothetical protein
MMMSVMNTVRNYAMIDERERVRDGVIPKRMKRKRSNVELAWKTLWKELNAT